MSATAQFDQILKKLGWVDGFQIPVANAENEALQSKVADLIQRKARAISDLENVTAKHDALAKHLKHVSQQHEEQQKLLTAYMQQLKSEEDLYLVAKSKKEVTERQIQAHMKNISEIASRQEMKKNDLERALVRVERLKAETSWDAEALRAWEEALRKRDEDNELLKRFAKEDEKKIKELEVKRGNLQTEVVEKRKCVDKVVTDVANQEQVLEKIGKIFKQQKEQRASLVHQWKDAIRNLRQRDNNIDQTNNEIIAMKELLKQKEENLSERQQVLTNEQNNNKELQMEISDLSNLSVRLRKELETIIPTIPLLNNELEAMKRMVTATARNLQKERTTGQHLDEELTSLELKREQLGPQIIELQQQLQDIKNNSSSVADRTKQIEKLFEEEQRKEKTLLHDMENLQTVIYRVQQVLISQKSTAKTAEIEIKSCEASINLSRKQAKNIYNEIQKQNEILYEMDYRICEMEKRLAHLESRVPDAEYYELSRKIESLEEEIAEQYELRHLLQVQVNKLEDEKRKLTSEFSSDEEYLKNLQNKLQDQLMIYENGTKHMKSARLQTQEKQVEENVLKLRVHQLEQVVKKEEKNIYNSQKFRLDLETAMKERQIEIGVNRDVLLVRKRNLDEENGRLKRDIVGRQTKMEQLQKKYYLTMMSLGKDEDGRPITISYYKIKNAQEKYMLQKEGDELDQKVSQAEQEIVAMENTLKVINMTNETYKRNLMFLDESDEPVQILKAVEKQYDEVIVKLEKLKRNLCRKRNIIKELGTYITELEAEKEKMLEQVLQLTYEVEQCHKYDADKLEKIERVDRQLSHIQKKINPKLADKHLKDLLIQNLQSANKYALGQLLDFTETYPDMGPLIKRYAEHFDVELPAKKRSLPSVSSTSSPSTASMSSRPQENSSNSISVASVVLSFDAAPEPVEPKRTSLKGKKKQ